MPAVLALPMALRSRKENRYRICRRERLEVRSCCRQRAEREEMARGGDRGLLECRMGRRGREEEERAAGAGLGDELPCPFCGEELDAVGLWCHMDDEHHAEANAGVISSRSLMGRCNFYSFLYTRSSSSSRRSVVHPMMFRGTLLGFYFGRVWGMPASLT